MAGTNGSVPAVIPPIVHLQRIDGPAYLLEWQETVPGRWDALVAWMEWDGRQWVGRRTVVPKGEVTRVEGQVYEGVPRMRVNDLRMREERQGRQRSS